MKRALVLVSRALLRRCPACGGGPIFTSWTTLRTACPGCGLVLEREEGYYTGAIGFNLIFSELLWAICLLGAMIATWPSPPWAALLVGSVVLMLLFPIAFYPFSKTLWIAFDLYFRPVERQEFQRHQRSRAQPGVRRP